MPEPFRLPEDFLMGSATAAAQIEGGNSGNNWYRWSEQGTIRDGSSFLREDDHWNRYREDVALLKSLGHKVYRMSLEWSRIEPRKGEFDAVAMKHYRDEIELLVQNGIRPLVTLHHFTHPLWLCDEGEFETEDVVPLFVRYVRYVVENIGDLVAEYITINEPNVYVANGYIFGIWPPGRRSLRLAGRVYCNMALCHMAAYREIHALRSKYGFPGKTMVGVAHHLRLFTPYNRLNPLDRLAAPLLNLFFQNRSVELMARGKARFPFSRFTGSQPGEYQDFIGINYYTRSAVRFVGFRDGARRGRPKNDLGWEIYPHGIAKLCARFGRKYGLPVWITENGVCDNRDAYRARFIYDHLREIASAIHRNVRIERYYHWSLLDNFEWLEGEAARFGLVHTDYATQQRTVKSSGRFYSEIIRNAGVTREMIRKYL